MSNPAKANETRSLEAAYQAAQDGVLAVKHDRPGVLVVHGADRLDLLHRMSTNELASLAPGEQRQTVFTDPVGRTIDLVTTLHADDRTLLVGSPGRAERLRDWLQKHVFFQDQVTLELPEVVWSLWGLYGPRAADVAGHLSGHAGRPDAQAAGALPARGSFKLLDASFLWPVGVPVPGFAVLTASEQVARRLAEYGGRANDRRAYDVLRVEAGLPAPDKEMLDDSIPLEIGLRSAINFSKGCYVGQEIIARMDSRDQLAKQLVRLRFDRQPQEGSALKLGERTVGTITSVARSPRLGWIGIGSVRSRAAQEPQLQVDGGELIAQVIGPVAHRSLEAGR